MTLWERIKKRFKVFKPKKKEANKEMNYLQALPEFKAEQQYLNDNLGILETTGPICNTAEWHTVTRDIVVNVEIPIGFERDTTQPFELLISADKSCLCARNEVEMKPADVYIEGSDGIQTMRCRVETIRKFLEGEIILNIVAKGFKATKFLEAAALSKSLELEEKTEFAHEQEILFDDTVGYMCKECQEEDAEVTVVLNITGKPFIMLADGTKIEEEEISTGAVDGVTIIEQGTTSTFDETLDGKETKIISLACELIVQADSEFIS